MLRMLLKKVVGGRSHPTSGSTADKSAGVDQAVVSADRQSVGWLVRFYASPTSYPKPLKLVVLTEGRVLTISGSGGPIGFWSFQDGGEHVALYQTASKPPRTPVV